jgi:hypothetical protein
VTRTLWKLAKTLWIQNKIVIIIIIIIIILATLLLGDDAVGVWIVLPERRQILLPPSSG